LMNDQAGGKKGYGRIGYGGLGLKGGREAIT
jgi:hypothetical protein